MKNRALAAGVSILLVTACAGGSAASTTTTPASPTTTTAVPPTTVTSLANPVVVPALRPPPQGVDPDSSCMQRAVFDDPARSEYLLPYPEGTAYRLNQSYCFAQGGHSDELAYDFLMPIGSDVVASRAGTVVDLFDGSPDDESGYANYVIIEHDDGTAAMYAHLQQHSLQVEYGQSVTAGDLLASSGFSGEATVPHLHFAVFGDWPDLQGGDIAVNFRNTDGPLDFLGGLLRDGVFLALPPADPPVSQPVQRPGGHAGADLGAVDLEGAVLWDYDFTAADLTGARLAGADLGHASLRDALLARADLSGANLASADLRQAALNDADLTGADLSVADLTGATLIGADLSGAYLASTDLTGADLTEANLDRATLIGVVHDASTRWPAGFEPPPQP